VSPEYAMFKERKVVATLNPITAFGKNTKSAGSFFLIFTGIGIV